MKKAKLLNQKEIEQISKFNRNTYKFDLSRINIEMFDSLIRTLPGFCSKKNVQGIGFNTDLLIKTIRSIEEKARKAPRNPIQTTLPMSLQHSASKKKKDFEKIVLNCVIKCLANAPSLNFIKFRMMNLQYPEIELLASAVYASDTLRTIRFCDVPIGDKGFSRFCRALRKKSVTEVQFRKCGLTDACGEDLASLLSYQVFIQSDFEHMEHVMGTNSTQKVCLQILDLRDNDFTYKFINEVEDSFLDIPLKTVDLRGNLGLTAAIVAPLQIKVPQIQIITGISKEPKSKAPKGSQVNAAPSSEFTGFSSSSKKEQTAQHIQALEEENDRFRALIEELQSGANIAELEEGLMIVGPRARELVEHITKLDELLGEAKRGPPPFLAKTRRRTAAEESRRAAARSLKPKKKKLVRRI